MENRMNIVEGVLSEGEVAFIVGEPVIVSSAATSLGISVARGGEWMGWKIPQYRQVLCVQRYWTKQEFAGIVGCSILDPQTKTPEAGYTGALARFINFTPEHAFLGDEAGHAEFLGMIEQWNPALIVLISLDSLVVTPTQYVANHFEVLQHVSRVMGTAVLAGTTCPHPIGSTLLDTIPDAIWEIRDDGKPVAHKGWAGTLRIRRKATHKGEVTEISEVKRRYAITTTLRFVAASQ